MSRAGRVCGAAVVAWAALALPGCGVSGLYEVSGEVTLHGKPLESGQIRFDPMPGGGASAGATVANGRYLIPAAQGLPPGKYKVFISALGGNPQAKNVMPGSEPPPDLKDAVPEKYNLKTTLTCDVAAAKNVKNFPLD